MYISDNLLAQYREESIYQALKKIIDYYVEFPA